MKQLAIAILCHWRSGSSLTAKILNACGMHTGNEATGWVQDVDKNQCEHGVLNTVGNHLFHAGYDEDYLSKVAPVLEAYKVQGWKVFGVKFTHVLQEKCWKYLGPIFKKCWPDAQYIISVRHPMGIIKSLEGVDPDAIVESWMSSIAATKELAKNGAIVLIYPDSFMSKDIRSVPEKVGLKWSKKATDLIDQKQFKKSEVTVADARAFKKNYPEADKAFEELKRLRA